MKLIFFPALGFWKKMLGMIKVSTHRFSHVGQRQPEQEEKRGDDDVGEPLTMSIRPAEINRFIIIIYFLFLE